MYSWIGYKNRAPRAEEIRPERGGEERVSGFEAEALVSRGLMDATVDSGGASEPEGRGGPKDREASKAKQTHKG